MSGHRNWSEIRESRKRDAAVSDEARAAVKKKLLDHAQTLAELRRARLLTQRQLARLMRVSQAQVSRVENQTDLYLSTLRSYVEAIGGELQIRVAFPGSGWTEVTVGDVTASGDHHGEDPILDPSPRFNTPALELLVQPSPIVGVPPLAQQLSAICFNAGRSGSTWVTYATDLRNIMARHRDLLASSSDSGAILYESDEDKDVGVRRFAWRTARDPHIPEDSERFISSAEIKEP